MQGDRFWDGEECGPGEYLYQKKSGTATTKLCLAKRLHLLRPNFIAVYVQLVCKAKIPDILFFFC